MAKMKQANKGPEPPQRYREFVRQYPLLWEAWEKLGAAGREGPLDERTCRLVKLAVAMGAMREGAVRSGTRKALAEGRTMAELQQLVALAAGTLGMPSTVACFSWMTEAAAKKR